MNYEVTNAKPELDRLINELDQLEGKMLQPASEGLAQEQKQIESQNVILESLLKEREQLLSYAQKQIQPILQEAVDEVSILYASI